MAGRGADYLSGGVRPHLHGSARGPALPGNARPARPARLPSGAVGSWGCGSQVRSRCERLENLLERSSSPDSLN